MQGEKWWINGISEYTLLRVFMMCCDKYLGYLVYARYLVRDFRQRDS